MSTEKKQTPSDKIDEMEVRRRVDLLKTPMKCMECGKEFRKLIGPKTFEVKCPKCGSHDTEAA